MPEARHLAPGPRARADPVRLERVASRQSGVVSRAQLESCGISGSAISRWARCRRLVRLYPGVYAVGHRTLSVRGRLLGALFHAGPGAVLSHTTAAWCWGFVEHEPRVIHLSAPIGREPTPGVRIHRPRALERQVHNGFAVTPVPRTLLDLAAIVSRADLRRAVAEADRRRLLDPAAAHEQCRRGRPGSRALRSALETHLPQLAKTLSVLEERFLALCELHEIALPEVNSFVAGLKVDALWRLPRLIAELDGHDAHAYPAAVERDRSRELALRAAGYEVRRYTWQQVTERPELVVADLRAALSPRD